MNAQDLISSSMRLIGALSSGETATGAEISDSLMVLQQMLDSWAADRLTVYTISIQTFPIVSNKSIYTMGPGGDFNVARPAKINRASIVSLTNPNQPLEIPIDIYTDAEWQNVPVKSIMSPLAQGLYDDGAYPLRNLTYWPIPSAGAQTILYSWTALSTFTDLVTDHQFPPGYLEALRYNLAMRLIAEMPGDYNPIMLQTAGALAVESLARVRSINLPLIEAKYDGILTGQSPRYNYYSDMPVGGSNKS